MGDVEIPDDFYITMGYLCHKSCLYINSKFSNDRNMCIYGGLNYTDIDRLRFICNTCDKIEEITHFVNGKFNKFYIYACSDSKIVIYNNKYYDFGSLDEALQYLRENYPECIKNDDIKIALKD